MGYKIDKQIIIEFTEEPSEELLRKIYEDVICNEVGESDTYTEEFESPVKCEFRLAGNVSASFNSIHLLNVIHEASDTIESVVAVDLETPYGNYEFERSDKTTENAYRELSIRFVKNIQHTLENVLLGLN